MAGDWIKMRTDLSRDPAVIRLSEVYGWPEHVIVGLLHKLWSWADEQVSDGMATGVSAAFIDRHLGVDGFAESMISIGWLEENEDGLVFPNWDRHMSSTAKKRASGAARVARHRNASVTPARYKSVTIPRPIRRRVLDRDGSQCVYCGRSDGDVGPRETKNDAALGIDHVIPQSRGGDTSLGNLVTCCNSCNRFKGDRTPDECDLEWPLDVTGKRYGSVTQALPEKRREEKSIKNTSYSCPEPESPAAGPASDFRFPINATPSSPSREWVLPSANLERYIEVYDHLDVPKQLKLATVWLESNPGRRKSASGMLRFLTTWMNKASGSKATPPASKGVELDREQAKRDARAPA